MSGEQAIFNLEIKKKRGLSLNPDIHHSKVFSSEQFTLNHAEQNSLHWTTQNRTVYTEPRRPEQFTLNHADQHSLHWTTQTRTVYTELRRPEPFMQNHTDEQFTHNFTDQNYIFTIYNVT